MAIKVRLIPFILDISIVLCNELLIDIAREVPSLL